MARRELPAPFLREIGKTGVHELDPDRPELTRCGLVIVEHNFEGWATRPGRLRGCPGCQTAGAIE